MRFSRVLQISFTLIFLLVLAGCGGGDGTTGTSSGSADNTSTNADNPSANAGNTSANNVAPPPPSPEILSGVAATGIPISGTITLKDSNGAQLGPITTDFDGGYSFDVTGLTPPFLLRAEWSSDSQTYRLFSVATSPGNIHINPFTNLALMLSANSDPSLIFGAEGAKPDTSRISEESIAAAFAIIKTALAPILNYYGIDDFNPMTGSYTATPDNKLDAMLDLINIKVENGVLTITNKLTGSVIGSSRLGDLPQIMMDTTKLADKSDLTDIREITQFVGLLCSVMNLGAELTISKVDPLFFPDPSYGTSNGHTRAQDVKSIVDIFAPGGTNPNGKLKTIRNVRLIKELTADYSGRGAAKVFLLNYDFIHENGTVVHGNNTTIGKETSTGLWKFIGDPVQYNAGSNYGGCDFTIVWDNFGVTGSNSGVSITSGDRNYGDL